MVIHQLIQRIKLHHPQEILPGSVTEHLEVLHVISKPADGENRPEAATGLRRAVPKLKVSRELLSGVALQSLGAQ